MDEGRLVFPIAMAIPLCYVIFTCLSLIYPASIVNTLSAGLVATYICYDMGHYYLHHSQPMEFVQYRKKYHMYHHYKDPDNGYGITTSLWDKVFGTELNMTKNQINKASL
jgi:4-hydroxysphinganine ceramide fatty acyl 2-hydroxylase